LVEERGPPNLAKVDGHQSLPYKQMYHEEEQLLDLKVLEAMFQNHVLQHRM